MVLVKKPGPGDVSIAKFDILATHTYAESLLDDLHDEEARERGMVAAIMGAEARMGHTDASRPQDYRADKQDAEKKKKTTTTAGSFDEQVADEMGEFFDDVFLPTMTKLVEAGLSYDEVKKAPKIPGTWGAKIAGVRFEERAKKVLE